MYLQYRRLLLILGLVLATAWCIPAIAALQPGNAPGLPVFVDEPVGPTNRHSLGMTMWHLGHNPSAISEFHDYVTSRNYTKEDLLPSGVLTPPTYSHRILLEPELLPSNQRDGWTVSGQYLTSTHGDTGPTVDFPLQIPRGGMYRLWVQYQAWASYYGVTRIRIYPQGQEDQAPLLDDEIYDVPPSADGVYWKDMLVDLPQGNYTVTLAHVLLNWHINTSPAYYASRYIDTIYLTDEIWNETPPTETEQTNMRNGSQIGDIQWNNQHTLSSGESTSWANWVLRPIDWDQRDVYPTLFSLSYDFWRETIDDLGSLDYVESGSLPDYRTAQRQVVFDEKWNLCANPVLVKRASDAMANDISSASPSYLHHRLNAGDFSNIPSPWYKNGDWLYGPYYDFTGTASHTLTMAETDDYYVWVRIQNSNYHEPYQITVDTPSDDPIVFNRTAQYYSPPDGSGPVSAWIRIGAISANAGQSMTFAITPLSYISPGTHRAIHCFEITNDPNFVPTGTTATQSSPLHYRLNAGNFETIGSPWYRDGEWLLAPYYDFSATASHSLLVDRSANYHVWARVKNTGYYEPYRITVDTPSASPISWDRIAQSYTPVDGTDAYWKYIGVIYAQDGERLDFTVSPLSYMSPGTHRGIHCFEVTTDGSYTPSGTTPVPAAYVHYRQYPGMFNSITGAWYRDGEWLRAGYGDFTGTASHALTVEETADYHVWARIKNAGYHEPYQITVDTPSDSPIVFNRTSQSYSPVDGTSKAWVKIGIISANAGESMSMSITPLSYISPGTDRGIHAIEITTDPNFVPSTEVEYPTTAKHYMKRAVSLGGNQALGYMAWLASDPYESLDHTSWPASTVPGASMQYSINMARNSYASVPLFMRSLVDDPLTLTVTPGNLTDGANSYSGKVQWRVIGFTPNVNTARNNWTPFLLMRRPNITVPQYNVAGLWFTIITDGVPAGNYTSTVTISTPGYPNQTLTLNVYVKAVDIAPTNPILASGFSTPPEGEIYIEDFAEHGLNIWHGEMSTSDMDQWGIRMLYLPTWANDSTAISERFTRLSNMGLSTNDYVLGVLDEPYGTTQQQLQPFIDIANTIHSLDANAKVIFNPGELGSTETFQILDSYANWWNSYVIHFDNSSAKAIFSTKPYLWYTTPCYWDKYQLFPGWAYDQFRAVPAQTGQIKGTAFFALNYPFRDHWDTAHEYYPDVSVIVLPSRQGPVATRTWEAVREGIQHANLAQRVKELGGPSSLVNSGTVAELLDWLD